MKTNQKPLTNYSHLFQNSDMKKMKKKQLIASHRLLKTKLMKYKQKYLDVVLQIRYLKRLAEARTWKVGETIRKMDIDNIECPYCREKAEIINKMIAERVKLRKFIEMVEKNKKELKKILG